MSSTTTSSTPSSSVESTISHQSCEATNATVSVSLPTVLNNERGHDMKLWCQTVVESDATSSTQESGKNSPIKKSDSQSSSSQQRRPKRFNRSYHKQQNNGGGYPPTFGQCPNTRSALASEQLEELMRLCNHEYQSNESYYHAINALLRQIQEIRGAFTPSGGASRASSADAVTPICATLPSPPINRALPVRLFRRIEVPENPAFNLIGRVLGPRGLTVRELETRFQCRIYVRGNGSIRDPEKARKLLDKPGWEHLTENLHILIIAAGGDKLQVESRLNDACDFINRLLHPRGFDSFKRRQLVCFALLNGTFRPQQFQQNDRVEQSQQNQISVH